MATEAQLIARVEARLDTFEKQLKQAGVMADGAVKDIESKFSKLDLTKIFTAGGFFGNILTQAFDTVKSKIREFIESLVKLQEVATLTGDSLKDLAAAQVALGDPSGFAEGAKTLARALDDVKKGGTNILGDVLKAEGVDINKLKTVNELLLALADIFQRLDKFDQIKLGEKLGLTAGMTSALSNMTELKERIEGVKQSADLVVHIPIEHWLTTAAQNTERLKKELQGLYTWYSNLIRLRHAESVGPSEAEQERIRQSAQALAGALPRIGGTTPAGQLNIPSGTLEARGAAEALRGAKESSAATQEKLSALQRLVIEQEKQANLAKVELEMLGKSTQQRAIARAEVEAQAAIQRDVERGLKIAPELIEQRTQKIRESAAAEAEFQQQLRNTNEIVNSTKAIMSDALKTFVAALREGKSAADAMRESLDRISERLLDKALDLALNVAFSGNIAGTGTGGGFGGGLATFLTGLFGGNRMAGGSVSAGKFYMVGEAGPELVRFGQSGAIMPNMSAVAGMGGGVDVTIINNGAQVSQSTKRRSDGGIDLKVVVDAAVSELVSTPGTNTNRALRMGMAPLIRRS